MIKKNFVIKDINLRTDSHKIIRQGDAQIRIDS
jgi:hypothetical protein